MKKNLKINNGEENPVKKINNDGESPARNSPARNKSGLLKLPTGR